MQANRRKRTILRCNSAKAQRQPAEKDIAVQLLAVHLEYSQWESRWKPQEGDEDMQ